MRVAIDVGPLVGRRTGIGQAVASMVAAIDELDPGPELIRYVLSARAPLDVGVRRLPYPAVLAQRAWSATSIPRADRSLGRPDVIHGTNYVVPPANCQRLVTVYDCWFLTHPDRVHRDVARAGAVLRRAVKTGAVVHAPSTATADRVRELLGPARVVVIPLAPLPLPSVDVAQIGPEPCNDGAPYILALGTQERRKNLPRLIAAFAQLHSTAPDHRLVLAGAQSDDSAAIQAAIDELPGDIARKVVRLGWVDDGQRAWLLRHAAVLAYPSLDEGFGFPLLEAMAAGTPVVASSAGSIPEVAGDAAILVPADDPVALAAALGQAIADDDLRRRLISAGAARVLSYSWQRTAERLDRLYHDLAMGVDVG